MEFWLAGSLGCWLDLWPDRDRFAAPRPAITLLAGAFFLVLPSHAKAVTWISGRTDVIAASFMLSSLAAYLHFRLHARVGALGLSLGLFVLGLASKESVFALPLVLLWCDVWLIKRIQGQGPRAWLVPLVFVGTSLVYLLLRRVILGTLTGGYSGVLAPLTLVKVLPSFVAAAYLPQLPSAKYYALSLLIILVLCVWQFVKHKNFPFLIVWSMVTFLLSALPALYIALIIGGVHADGQNERFIYLPSAFSCIGLALLLCYLLHGQKLKVAAVLLMIVFGVQIYRSNRNWKVAGEVSQDLIFALGQRLPARDVIVLTVPDTLRGAYVYRNGFEAAIALFHPNKFRQISVVCVARYWSPQDETAVTAAGTATYLLHLPNPEIYGTRAGACGLFDFRRTGIGFQASLEQGLQFACSISQHRATRSSRVIFGRNVCRAAKTKRAFCSEFNTPMTPPISVSIVSYNTRELLRKCLLNLREQDEPLQILVVDNDSTDGSPEMVRAEFPEVELIQSGGNIGFGRANNLAFERAHGKYFLLLNSDAFPLPGALTSLRQWMDAHPDCGAVGPQLLFPDGAPQISWGDDPQRNGIFWEQTFLGAIRGGRAAPGHAQSVETQARPVDQLPGACELVRSEAYGQIGGFDPNFWMYVEDVDFNIRLRAAGWEIWLVPQARVAHHLGGSSGKWQSRARMVGAYNASRFYFYGKIEGPRSAQVVKRWMVLGALIRCAIWTSLVWIRPGARDKIKLFRYVLRRTTRL